MKAFLLLVMFSSGAFSQVNFNSITYSGTGCPDGTVSTAVSPDGSSLSILFDEFRAEVPQYDSAPEVPRGPRSRNRNSVTFSHKNCALSFTATLPPGVMAESLEVSMQARGATMLDMGVNASFASILVGYNGLARSRGRPTVVARRSWRTRTGPIDDAWTEEPKALIPLHSGCSGSQGRDIRFDLKNHVDAEITSGNLQSSGIITVDSNDVKGLLTFTIGTRPCGRRYSGARMSP